MAKFNPNSRALTLKATGRVNVLQSPCDVQTFDPNLPPNHQYSVKAEFTAIWDTGATNSVITQRVVDARGLMPSSVTQIHAVNSSTLADQYRVVICLPNNVVFVNVPVANVKLQNGIDVLIGMDIITLGDFVITNQNQQTVFSFRVPSESYVDYVERFNEEHRKWKLNNQGGRKGKKRH